MYCLMLGNSAFGKVNAGSKVGVHGYVTVISFKLFTRNGQVSNVTMYLL